MSRIFRLPFYCYLFVIDEVFLYNVQYLYQSLINGDVTASTQGRKSWIKATASRVRQSRTGYLLIRKVMAYELSTLTPGRSTWCQQELREHVKALLSLMKTNTVRPNREKAKKHRSSLLKPLGLVLHYCCLFLTFIVLLLLLIFNGLACRSPYVIEFIATCGRTLFLPYDRVSMVFAVVRCPSVTLSRWCIVWRRLWKWHCQAAFSAR